MKKIFLFLTAGVICDSFTAKERFEVLMEATGGGKVMPQFDKNDFVELIGKPNQVRQLADFKMVVHFTSLGEL